MKLCEHTQAVRSECSRASGAVEEQARRGVGSLRLRCAPLRPNGKGSSASKEVYESSVVRSSESVITDKIFDGAAVIAELVGERSRCTRQPRVPLPERTVESFDVIGYAAQLGARTALGRRNDPRVSGVVVGKAARALMIPGGNLLPPGFGTGATAVADVKGKDLARSCSPGHPHPLPILFRPPKAPALGRQPLQDYYRGTVCGPAPRLAAVIRCTRVQVSVSLAPPGTTLRTGSLGVSRRSPASPRLIFAHGPESHKPSKSMTQIARSFLCSAIGIPYLVSATVRKTQERELHIPNHG
jgi:hypothetical protein